MVLFVTLSIHVYAEQISLMKQKVAIIKKDLVNKEFLWVGAPVDFFSGSEPLSFSLCLDSEREDTGVGLFRGQVEE